MRKITTSTFIAAMVLIIACKKQRTCSCTSEITTTTVSTPRNGGQPTSSTSTSKNENANTYEKVTKGEMMRLLGCTSRIENSTNSYTSTSSVQTPTSVAGFTYMVTQTTTVDVVGTTKRDYTCEIK